MLFAWSFAASAGHEPPAYWSWIVVGQVAASLLIIGVGLIFDRIWPEQKEGDE